MKAPTKYPASLRVRREIVRPESDPEGGCIVVRVGERVIAFVPNEVQSELLEGTLRTIIAEAKELGGKLREWELGEPARKREQSAKEAEDEGEHEVAMMIRMGR